MDIDAGSLGAVAAAVAVPVVMGLLAKLFPARPNPTSTSKLADLQPKYRGWEAGLGLGTVALAVPIGYGLWIALRGIAALHASLLPKAELAWYTDPYYWALPALFLAIILMIPISTWIAKRLLGARYEEYLVYQQLKFKMDSMKVARLLFIAVGLGSAVFIALGLDWYVQVRADGFALNRYFGIGEERHAFDDIRRIRTAPALIAPNGNTVQRREYVVQFADGRSWSTNNLLVSPSDAEKKNLADLLAERSGVRIEEAEVFGRDDL